MTRSRQRVVIENVSPEIDGGRFPAKRTVGQTVRVEADIHTDGHDLIAAVLMYRKSDSLTWSETPMIPEGNDRWAGVFRVASVGRTVYTLHAWIARVRTWQRDLSKKIEAGQDVSVDLLIGALLAEDAAKRARGADRRKLLSFARTLRPGETHGVPECATAALNGELGDLADRYPDRTLATRFGRELPVVVDRERARFGAWYELFPRSCSSEPGRHGTFKDVEERLPYVAAMGFDVLYLPPIHPIGRTHRKGRNNATVAEPEDVGSPWAIGAAEGGHKAVHPAAGDARGFRRPGPVRPGPRDRDRAGHRLPVLAGPPVRDGAPRVVPDAPGRHDPVRREPAEEIPGHLSRSISRPTAGGNSGRS